MQKRFLSLLMAIITVFSLAACGETPSENVSQNEPNDTKEKVWYFGGSGILADNLDYEELFEGIEDTVDAEKIYSELEYTEDMLYGSYVLNNKEKDLKKVRKEIPFNSVEFTDATYNISELPVGVYLGKENVCSALTGYKYGEYQVIEDCEIAVLEFSTEDDLGTVVCSYEISGNKIKFTEINVISEAEEEFEYQKGKAVWEYVFSVSGPYFTLTNGENSLKLVSYYFSENSDGDLWLTGYSILETPLIDELDYFSASGIFQYAVRRDGSYYDKFAFKISDNGLVTAYLYDKNSDGEEEVFTKQYAYLINGDSVSFSNRFGIILLDGENEYRYTDSITVREARILEEDLGNVDLSEEKIEEIAEKKANLFDDLYKEFESRGINVTINRATGEMFMDSSVVFGGDSAEITEEGKELINKFLEAYTSIIFNEKYEGFVAKTRIEGHTAPIAGSTYESGLPLSEERANNVKEYCLETGVDTEKLAAMLEAVGYSNSKPIYGADGKVDMNASRRVSFRFIVNIEE